MKKDTKKKKTLTEADLSLLFSQLSILSESSDARVDDALSVMAEDPANRAYADILKAMLEETSVGGSFSEAAAHTGVFPAFALNFLKIGEATGRQDLVFRDLAAYYEDQDTLRASVRDALSYPVLMAVLMAAVIVFLLAKVVPVFADVFTQLGSSAVGIAAFSASHSGALTVLYVVLLVLAGAFAAAFFVGTYTERGRRAAALLLPKIPAVRGILSLRRTAQLAGILQMAVSVENSDMAACLRLARGMETDEELFAKIDRCLSDLGSGLHFCDACEKEALFTPFCCGLLHAADKSGSTEKALSVIAERYGAAADRKRDQVLSSIEPTMVIVLSVVVGLILFSVLIPLAGIMGSIG